MSRMSQMAGDLAEHIGERVIQRPDGGWRTEDELDEYVIEHVMRLSPDEQRRMRATATVLLGLTASALLRAGTAPADQHLTSDNPHVDGLHMHIDPPA